MPNIKQIYVGTNLVRPKSEDLVYDFTTSDGGWTASSGTSRSSSGFYRSGTWSDGYIQAPSEIFAGTPKKITITYNKASSSSGTGIYAGPTINDGNYILVPYSENNLNYWEFKLAGGSSTTVNSGGNTTGNVTWEMDIDSSTTNRTVTHKVTGLSNITDNYGVIKAMWQGSSLYIRIVNLRNGTGSLYLKGVTIEY